MSSLCVFVRCKHATSAELQFAPFVTWSSQSYSSIPISLRGNIWLLTLSVRLSVWISGLTTNYLLHLTVSSLSFFVLSVSFGLLCFCCKSLKHWTKNTQFANTIRSTTATWRIIYTSHQKLQKDQSVLWGHNAGKHKHDFVRVYFSVWVKISFLFRLRKNCILG